MLFAEFYHESTGWNGTDFSGPTKLIPMCGSDGVFTLDARMNRGNLASAAKKRAEMLNANLGKGIKGFKIMRGGRGPYTDSRPVGELVTL